MQFNRLLPTLSCLVLVLAGCQKWGSIEDAKKIFYQHRIVFERIYKEIENHPELKEISSDYNPRSARDMALVSKYQDFSEDTKAAYSAILRDSRAAGIERVAVARSRDARGNSSIEWVSFVLFDVGLASDAEGIEVVRVGTSSDLRLFDQPPTSCTKIDEPNWYACDVK